MASSPRIGCQKHLGEEIKAAIPEWQKPGSRGWRSDTQFSLYSAWLAAFLRRLPCFSLVIISLIYLGILRCQLQLYAID